MIDDYGYGMNFRREVEKKIEELIRERDTFSSQYEKEKKKVEVLTTAFDEKVKSLTEENMKLEIKNQLLFEQLKGKQAALLKLAPDKS